jgi:hypothetical protein
MAGQEITNQHRPPSFGLDFEDAELTITGCDMNYVAVDLEDGAGTFVGRLMRSAADAGTTQNEPRAVQERVRVRPRIESAYAVMDVGRGLRPIDEALFLSQPRRIRRQ